MACYLRLTKRRETSVAPHGGATRPAIAEEGELFSNPLTWPTLFLVMVLPNLWLFSGFFQIFQPPGWVDPGIYLGYFLELSARIENYGANYFSMRLPFTALGASLFQVFPPETAQKALIVFFNSLAALGVFILVGRRVGIVAGVIASWWLTLNPLWIASVTRGYVDGPAMGYVLVSLALLDYREDWKGSRRLVVGLGGAFGALAVFTHPITALLVALFGFVDIWSSRRQAKQLFADILHAAIGGAAATVALAVVSRMVNGRFLFFLADPSAFSRSLMGFGANYRYDLVEWVPDSYRLAPFFALLILGGFLLLKSRDRNQRALALRGLSMAAGAGLFLLFWDYMVGGAMLQSSFYSSYMIPGQALIIGSAAGYASYYLRRPLISIIITGGILVLFAFAVYGHVDAIWSSLQSIEQRHLTVWMALGGVFTIAVVLVFSSLRMVGLVLLLASTMIAGLTNHDTRRIFIPASGVDFGTTFRSTMKVVNFVNQNVGPNDRLLFWFQRTEMSEHEASRREFTLYTLRYRENYLLLNYWDSLVAVWLWDRALLGSNMPDLAADELTNLRRLNTPTSVVTLCLDESRCNSAAPVLSSYGFDVTSDARITIDTGYIPMTAVIYKLVKHD
ncbi:hypothetical protein Kim5_CH00898 [Rhizobium sp. Kim5]|uniref:hypothetical protein n=1 Tax=Rhizobium sp. Kim5 TaxID=2020311 RepID=UPI000A29F985|nr:hypothetical protein [Rhizobium sp. Kim5]ARQ57005.1 hypothetical protein Kim5_CH00898 [Rhizobium sp. Kim5]